MEFTKSNFDAFRIAATEAILDSYEVAEGQMYPIVLAIDKAGQKLSFDVPPFMFDSALSKQMLRLAFKKLIERADIVALCLCTEAYSLQLEKGEDIPGHTASEDARRVEIVMMHFEAENFQHMTTFKVVRDKNDETGKVIELIPFNDHDLSHVEVGGELGSFFH